MTDRLFTSFFELLVYLLAAVSGGVGGCAAASMKLLTTSHRKILAVEFLSYIIVGVFIGTGAVVGAVVLGWPLDTWAEVLGAGGLLGFTGALALGGANLSVKVLAPKLGLEIDVSVRRAKKNGGDNK